ncbi:CDP-alcohol phosphatidyltransferase family protein [Allocoprobacillus halotolerans]|uniref:CDP-alcohol phosphatidyltransferase family protein n=1 Tax=Allocoprobacillus halotolerans TaxID=2944914 RepID=A0ABY5I7P7_9FIRM|nr:CDP-alcohol phosphatidyltransferase family protein [Allocoprobacillus halotolerans]UTY40743.1 CDP-alcohol phosphatidyltransferase family protein [Allocoprobacillus halotolerans]
MIGFYNYTVILTYLSLISALFGTHLAFKGNFGGALICLLLSGAFDSFDGMVARTKKDRTEEERKFGIQIDSLADMFSFGIFPAIIGYTMINSLPFNVVSWVWFGIFALYALCAISRLGYFNVVEEMRQKETTEKRKYYQGLPVTSAALIFPSVYLLRHILTPEMTYAIYAWVMFFTAWAFIVNFKVRKPGLPGIIGMLVIGIIICVGLLML